MRLERVERTGAVLLEILDHQQDRQAATIGRLIDLSISGMKINIDKAIAEHTLLRLRVDIAGREYRLYGKVRWARDEGKHYIGILLSTEFDSDYEDWTSLFVEDRDLIFGPQKL